MSSTNSDCFTSFLPILMILFLFLIWLPWLGFPGLCWIKLAKGGVLVLFLILEKKLSPFLVEYVIRAMSLTYMAFIILRYVALISTLLRVFLNHKWLLNFVKCFFYIYWDVHMIHILHLVNVGYHTNWFVDIKLTLHLWNKDFLWLAWYMIFNVLFHSIC